MRPRSLLFLSSLLLLAAGCAKASTTGGMGGDSSGPGTGGTTSSNLTTSSTASMGGAPTTGSDTTTGSNPTSSTGPGTTSTGSGTTTGSSTAASTGSGPVCAEVPCKLTVPQCGCAVSQQCTVNGSGIACGAKGNTGVGQVCAGPDCSPGLLCVNTTPTTSTCAKFCDSDADCTAPGGLCIIGLNDANNNVIPGVTLCTENCDPTTNLGCPVAGTSCEVVQENGGQMRYVTQCVASGAGLQGDTCVTSADCAPKFNCFNTTNPTAVKCLKNCKASAPNGCPAGKTCKLFATPEVIGGEEYGACL